MSGTCVLSFNVECESTKPGQGVFIVGASSALGDWNPAKAIPCTTTTKVFPNWSSETVTIPCSMQQIEFKAIIQAVDLSKPDKALWEKGPNRVLKIPECNKTVYMNAGCQWNNPEVTYRSKTDNTTLGGGLGLRTPEQAPEVTASSSPMPRVETGMNFTVEEAGETTDGLGELRSVSGTNLFRNRSRGVVSEAFGKMPRHSSRHLCIGADGMFNQSMSRVPSLMLIDEADLEEECKIHQEELDKLERDQLNAMQRRIPSGALIDKMKDVIDKADKNEIVLLQGFNWESWRSGCGDWYGIVGKQMDKFKHLGVTDIWLPPPSQSVAPQGYLPSRLFDLDGSKYGTQASLENLIKSLHENGIRAVADIVINHRCGDKQDSQGRWNQFSTGITNRPSFAGVMDWGGWAITLGDKFSDGTGENHPGMFDSKFDAAPNIDHANDKVQQSISIWLRWLQLQVGFDAWRFDFVKGYAAEYVGKYCKKSVPAWAVGELWGDMEYDDNGMRADQDKHRQDLTNWINATDKEATAFDFTTKGILQEAVRNTEYWRLRDKNGKPPGLIGWMPKHAVTFIDNHDTGSTQRHWPFPDDKVMVGYAYIITHPGIPALFWDHVMDWGEHVRNQIADLVKARRESRIPVDAPVKILTAEHDLYMAEIGSPPTLRVALGPRHPGDADSGYWSKGPSGNQYRVWVHRQQNITVTPPPPQKEEAPQKKEEKKVEKKKSLPKEPVICNFAAINVDGNIVTPEKLKSMSVIEVERLAGKLEPVLEAAKAIQASKK